MGFLIEPDCVNTYFADRKDPWEYAWIEFSGLRAKEILEGSGLSSDSPVYLPRTPQDGERLKNEILYLATHAQESSYHLIGHLYLSEEYERLTELVTIGLEAMEEKFDTERNEGAKNAGK